MLPQQQLEKLAHRFAFNSVHDPARFHSRPKSGPVLRHGRDDCATLDQAKIETDLARSIIGIPQVIVGVRRNDPEMRLIESLDHSADRLLPGSPSWSSAVSTLE